MVGRMGSQIRVKPTVRTVWTSYVSNEAPGIGPNMLRGPKRRLATTEVNFIPMPSM